MFRTSVVHPQERLQAVCCEFGMWYFAYYSIRPDVMRLYNRHLQITYRSCPNQDAVLQIAVNWMDKNKGLLIVVAKNFILNIDKNAAYIWINFKLYKLLVMITVCCFMHSVTF